MLGNKSRRKNKIPGVCHRLRNALFPVYNKQLNQSTGDKSLPIESPRNKCATNGQSDKGTEAKTDIAQNQYALVQLCEPGMKVAATKIQNRIRLAHFCNQHKIQSSVMGSSQQTFGSVWGLSEWAGAMALWAAKGLF